jgi:outer membrane protein assembly factor BamB
VIVAEPTTEVAARRRWPKAKAMAVVAGVVGLGLGLAGCGTSGSSGSREARRPTDDRDDCAAASTGPAAVMGFDPATGEERWSRLAGDASGVTDAAGLLLVAQAGQLVAYDPATGAAAWCRPGANVAGPRPAIAGGVLAVVGAGRLEGVDVQTGETRWSVPVDASPGAEIATDGSTFTVIAGGPLKRPQEDPTLAFAVVTRVDALTGAPVDGPPTHAWLQQQEGDAIVTIEERDCPGIDDVVGSDSATGAERWSVCVPLMGAVVLDRGVVFTAGVGQRGSRVTARDAVTGDVVWEADPQGIPTIFVAGDLVLVGGQAHLVALSRFDGSEVWSADFDTPGRGGTRTEPGYFDSVAVSADGTAAAGLIVAAEPHRD